MIPYKHEPFTDFTNEENKKAYLNALKQVEGYLGQDYPLNYWWRTCHYRRKTSFHKSIK